MFVYSQECPAVCLSSGFWSQPPPPPIQLTLTICRWQPEKTYKYKPTLRPQWEVLSLTILKQQCCSWFHVFLNSPWQSLAISRSSYVPRSGSIPSQDPESSTLSTIMSTEVRLYRMVSESFGWPPPHMVYIILSLSRWTANLARRP